jgi:UTP--glucose-1-phosphate uridylyltransferase
MVIPPVRKAVIPAAGFGTRFLPISKSIAKEMLPVVDKPVVQYVIEEAVASGITDILFIVSRNKRSLEEYFHAFPELEKELAAKQKTTELASVQELNHFARIHFTWQQEMRGLGDAVLHAKSFVGNEPFAVMLGDCILESHDPQKAVLRQLLDTYEATGASTVALEEVPEEKVSRYGIAGGTMETADRLKVSTWVEKPKPEEAPSRLAVSARYVFTPAIFTELATTQPGKNGEIQLTDAMRSLLAKESTYGVKYRGQRHDIGNKLEFLKTNLHFALQREDTATAMRDYIRSLAL